MDQALEIWEWIKKITATMTIIGIIFGSGFYIFNLDARSQSNSEHIAEINERMCEIEKAKDDEKILIKEVIAKQDLILLIYGVDPNNVTEWKIQAEEFRSKSSTRSVNLPDTTLIDTSQLIQHEDTPNDKLISR